MKFKVLILVFLGLIGCSSDNETINESNEMYISNSDESITTTVSNMTTDTDETSNTTSNTVTHKTVDSMPLEVEQHYK